MEKPVCIPDLNPVEILLDLLGNAVHARVTSPSTSAATTTQQGGSARPLFLRVVLKYIVNLSIFIFL